MKTITKITMNRISNTCALINQLPKVFTRKEYDTLRLAQIDQLWQDSPYPDWKAWRTKICREDSAFTVANLCDNDFLILVRSEPITIEVEKWNWYTRTNEKKSIDTVRHYYQFDEKVIDFLTKTIDNWKQM